MSGGEPVAKLTRAESGAWQLPDACAGETVELASLGVRLEVDPLFADPLPPA